MVNNSGPLPRIRPGAGGLAIGSESDGTRPSPLSLAGGPRGPGDISTLISSSLQVEALMRELSSEDDAATAAQNLNAVGEWRPLL